MGPPHWRLGCRAALLRGHQPQRAARPMLARLQTLPGDGAQDVSSTNGCCAQRLPAIRPRRPRSRPGTMAAPHPGARARRRRHPHRPAGRADGTRRNDGLVRREPAVHTLRTGGPRRCKPCPSRAGPRPCGGWQAGEAAVAMSKLRSAIALGENPAVQSASTNTVGKPAPTYRDAQPAVIDAAMVRHRRPGRAATGSVRRQRQHRPQRPARHLGGGVELSRGAAAERALQSVPGTCPHLGADLSTGTGGAAVHSSARGTDCAWTAAANSAGSRIRRTTTACSPGCGSIGVGGEEQRGDCRYLRARPAGATLHAVTRLVGTCEPRDIVANRLDPWHGAWYPPLLIRRAGGGSRRRRRTTTWPRTRTDSSSGDVPTSVGSAFPWSPSSAARSRAPS